jgi:hypothetical protein
MPEDGMLQVHVNLPERSGLRKLRRTGLAVVSFCFRNLITQAQ